MESLKGPALEIGKAVKAINPEATPEEYPVAVPTREASNRAAASFTRPARHLEERFCYRCGENGHVASECRNKENQSKVIKKLIH